MTSRRVRAPSRSTFSFSATSCRSLRLSRCRSTCSVGLGLVFLRYAGSEAKSSSSSSGLRSAGSAACAPVDYLPLASEAGVVLERVNHPQLRTIYPAVAQAAFALAHVIAPYELWAWKLICLVGDTAALGVLLLLLGAMGRSPLWALLFWWNPLILKEHANSAHMEALLVPLVLAAVWHAAKARPMVATLGLGLAAGIKVWPVLLAPLIWRQLWGRWWQIAGCAVGLAAMLSVWAAPVLVAGLDETSGFVAYVDRWQTNSALFPALVAGSKGRLPASAARSAQSTPGPRYASSWLCSSVGLGWRLRSGLSRASATWSAARPCW